MLRANSPLPPLVQTVLDRIPAAIGVFRLDGRSVFLNEAFKDLHAVIGDWTCDGMTLESRAEEGAFGKWLEDPRTYFTRLRQKLVRDGEFHGQVELDGRVISINDILIGPDLLLTIRQDVTEQVRSTRLSDHLARYDQLTALPNRATLGEALDLAMSECRERDAKFALLVVNVDRFKDVNDLYGEVGGDTVLKVLASRFMDVLGQGDFAARLDGDEFAFVCREGEQPEAAVSFAERLVAAASRDIEIEGRSVTMTVGVGVATFPDDGADRCHLTKSAQAALLRAKAEGRGSIRLYAPDTDGIAHERRLLLHDLRHAVERNQMMLFYQPQARMDASISGFEALLRWRHPEKGMISPDIFIPLAEQSNHIVEIGEWVLRTACREAAGWKVPYRVAVNISPVQMSNIDLPALIEGVLRDSGLDPSRLELEITEGVLIHDSARASDILCRLKAMGVMIAMDDFGTGYSSLSYLQAFPFDKLKIDKCFIHGITKVRQSNEIVRAIVGLGKGLEIPVIAEGVETEEEMEMLRTMQCQGVQGYLVGRPMPIENYRHLIDRRPGLEELEKLTEVRESHICSSTWIGDRKRTLRRELDEGAARMELADVMAIDL